MTFILLTFFYNLIIAVLLLFVIAFGLTFMLNPTATPKEIFDHWHKTFKGEC